MAAVAPAAVPAPVAPPAVAAAYQAALEVFDVPAGAAGGRKLRGARKRARVAEDLEQLGAITPLQYEQQVAYAKGMEQHVLGPAAVAPLWAAPLLAGVAALQADVTGIKADVAGIQADVAGIKADVAGIQGDVAGIQGDVAGIQPTLVALQAGQHNLHARTVNRDAMHRLNDALVPLHDPANQAPAGFPADRQDLVNLTVAQCNTFLGFYNLPIAGNRAAKIDRLQRFFTIA